MLRTMRRLTRLARDWGRGRGLVALGVAAATVLSTHAGAEEITIDRSSFGFTNTVPAERQTFLRLWISSGNNPWSGTITLRSAHDNTQDAVVMVSAATTPGVSVPVEIPLLLTEAWRKIVVTASDGRDDQRWTISRDGLIGEGIETPIVSSTGISFLCLGETTAQKHFMVRDTTGSINGPMESVDTPKPPETPAAPQPTVNGLPVPTAPWQQEQLPDPDARWRQSPVEIATDGLPVHWHAYDGYELVIATEEALSKETPQSHRALMEWVVAGGRLVILTDSAGRGWRALLHPGMPLGAFEMTEAREVTPSPELTAIANGVAEQSILLRPRPARTIRLTSEGVRDGWKVGWTGTGHAANEGMLAWGPYGMGMLGVMGVDPGTLTGIIGSGNTAAGTRLWRDVVRKVAWGGRNEIEKRVQGDSWWWHPASGATPETREALRLALDEISVVAPLGKGLFTTLLVTMLAMALLVGPGDAIILKRLRMRHRSWMTALLWIGIATGVAGLAPAMVRTGSHGYSVMTVDDVRVMPDGTRLMARASALGLFGGRPTELPLPECASGTVWRGVSPRAGDGGGFLTQSALTMASREIAIAGCRGAEMLRRGPNGEQPARVGVAQWAFRTLQSVEPCRENAEGFLSARITRDSFGVRVVLSGAPEEGQILDACLRMGDEYYKVTFAKSAEGYVSEALTKTDRAGAFIDARSPVTPGGNGGLDWSGAMPGTSTLNSISAAFSLDGVTERGESADALVAGGAYGVVCVKLKTGSAPGVVPTADMTVSRVWVSRIVAPIEGKSE